MRVAAACLVLLVVTLAGCDGTSRHSSPAASPTRTLGAPASGLVSPPKPIGTRDPCPTRPDLGAGQARDVLFRTTRVGWVVTARRVLATTDRGEHWTTSYRAAGRQTLRSVDFVDRRHGWIVASNGLLRTADGGQHWRRLPASCPRVQVVDFVTPRFGYAVAGPEPARNGATPEGVLLRTSDGGIHWHRVPVQPPQVQSVCIADRRDVWLGAGGNVYRSRGSLSPWRPIVHHETDVGAGYRLVANVDCTTRRAAWAVISCLCGAMSQSPHIGYHATGHGGSPLFAEQYFAHPGVHVRRESPGTYAGPFAVINDRDAVFFDVCPACSHPTSGSHGRRVLTTTEYSAIASDAGRRLVRPGPITGITAATAASFPNVEEGWVLGTRTLWLEQNTRTRSTTVLEHTSDGGRTWDVRLRI